MSGDYTYIWESADWPAWRFDLLHWRRHSPTSAGRKACWPGGWRMSALRDEASLAALTEDVVKTSAIEGESLNVASVRSSIARRLGVDIGALAPVDRHVEGVVDMVLDATAHAAAPVTDARLFGHAALFPTGYSGMSRITVGGWRTDATGPMQVVSGPIGRQRVHFEAPPAARLAGEIARFLAWLNAEPVGLLIRAGLAHQVRHAPSVRRRQRPDCACARGSGPRARRPQSAALLQPVGANPARAQRLLRRAGADAARLARRHGMARVVPDRARQGIDHAHTTLDAVLVKARFWQRCAGFAMNERQVKVMNRLLDGFEGS